MPKNVIYSNEYLADPIDYFKRSFLESLTGSYRDICLYKIIHLNGCDFEKYCGELKSFFKMEQLHEFESGVLLKKLKEDVGKKGKFLFIDPPTGLSFNKSENQIKWGLDLDKNKKPSKQHFKFEELLSALKDLPDADTSFSGVAIYQHFSPGYYQDDRVFEGSVKSFLRQFQDAVFELLDHEGGTKVVYVIKFKDFFIISFCTDTSIEETEIFKLQKNLDLIKNKTRFYKFEEEHGNQIRPHRA